MSAFLSTCIEAGAQRVCFCLDAIDSTPDPTSQQTRRQVLCEFAVVLLLGSSVYFLTGDILEAVTLIACVMAIVLVTVYQIRCTVQPCDFLSALAPRTQRFRTGNARVLLVRPPPRTIHHAPQRIDLNTSNIAYRVVSVGVQKENRRAYVGYVEVVTIASNSAVRTDVLRCEQVRATAALAYADAIGLKKRLEISEIGDTNAFGQHADDSV